MTSNKTNIRWQSFINYSLGRLKYAFLTLRGRLLIGSLVLWGVLCTTLLTYGWQAGSILVEETNRQHLKYEAELIRSSITSQINERLQALEGFAQGISDPTSGELTRNYQAQALTPFFDGIVFFDLDSQMVGSWPSIDGTEGVSFSDREYARFMHAFQRPYVSEPFIARTNGRPMVMLLVPVYDASGDYIGFLGGVVDINKSQLFQGISRLRLGDSGYVTITTASGQKLYQPIQQDVDDELSGSPPPALDLALYGWEGEDEGRTGIGQPALVAYRQIWPANWVVGVHLSKDQARAPLIAGMQRISYFSWWTMALLLPFVMVLIWLALRPLARLTEQVSELRDQRRHTLKISTQMPELRRIIDVINETEQARMSNLRDLSRREALLNVTLKSSPQGMFMTDSEGQPTFINKAVYESVGPSASEDFATWLDRIHVEDRDAAWSAWTQSLDQQQEFRRQFRFMDHDDKQRWVEVHARMINVNGEFIGTVGTIRDITLQRQENKKRLWEAEHDPLTGLLNRRGLMRRFDELLIEWQKSGLQTSVLVFDLDNFKKINDSGGHALGDLVLQKVAETICDVVRSSDCVARLGGDEFVVLLKGCSLDRACTLAEKLRVRISADVTEHKGKSWSVTASIGVSCFQQGDKTIDMVLARSDAASYAAKNSSRNKVVVSS